MASVKRWFVSVYLGYAAISAGWAVWEAIQGRWAWLGILPGTLPVLYLSVGNLVFNHSATTHRWLPVPSALAIAGLVWSLAWSVAVGNQGWVLPIQGILVASYGVYLWWYSSFGRKRSESIANGRELPAFHAVGSDGRRVDSRELAGAPALLVFYRGNWCPICVTQVKELAANYRALADLGIRVVMISPQSEVHTMDLARKVDAPLEFWRDPDLSAAKTLGLVDPNGVPAGMDVMGYDADTVLPTVIMTDAKGVVFYNDQTDSYRVRPLPEDFLEAYRMHGKI